MSSLLTVVVCIKDRSEFTERLCSYLSEIKYPYPLYFADGSIGDENETFFKNFQTENFHYIYKRYPKDLTLHDYYKKCRESVSEVKTPYLMFVDNDDFPIPSGQRQAITFLGKNPDFVGCNGQVAGVSLNPDVRKAYGKHILFHPYYCTIMDAPVNLDQNSGVERIDSYLKNYHSIFYSIFRTESIVNTQMFIETLNFSDLGVFELFFSYMQLTYGKVHTIKEITYVRQKGSSQAAALQKDWFHRLFYTNWLQDFKNTMFTVSNAISDKEKIDSKKCFENLYEMSMKRIRERFLNNQFYFFKNPGLFFRKENIINIILNKFFRVFPFVFQKISLRIFFENGNLCPELASIMKIIKDKTK